MDPQKLAHDFNKGSTIRRAEFDPSTGVLEVFFAGNQVTRWGGVSPEMWTAFTLEAKPGKWLADNVRRNPKTPEIKASASTPVALAPVSAKIDDKLEEPAAASADVEAPSAPADSVAFKLTPGERVDLSPIQAVQAAPAPATSTIEIRHDRDLRPASGAGIGDKAEPSYKSALARARASKKG